MVFCRVASQALLDLAARFYEHTNIPVLATISPDLDLDKILSSDTRHALYRVVQQALDNIDSHASAGEAILSIAYDQTFQPRLCFQINDNGIGFDLVEQNNDKSNGHFGLQSMFARIEAANGKIMIDTALGQGVHISGWVPVIDGI